MRDTKENRRLRALLWIVRLLERHGALTLKEINDYWCADESLSDGLPIERRTFYNYKNAILDLLKINIECDPRDGNRYRIMERHTMNGTKARRIGRDEDDEGRDDEGRRIGDDGELAVPVSVLCGRYAKL